MCAPGGESQSMDQPEESPRTYLTTMNEPPQPGQCGVKQTWTLEKV